MGWGRYLLLGDIGQQLDLGDRQREIAAVRQQLDSQWSRDQSQDQQIAALRAEVQDLKLYLASAMQLLKSKNVITQAELERIVHSVDR